MARLALIADALGETVIAAGVRSRMKTVLAPWLAGTNPNKLQYDPAWGGICSSAGLADGGADFGNGQYNEYVPCPGCYCCLYTSTIPQDLPAVLYVQLKISILSARCCDVATLWSPSMGVPCDVIDFCIRPTSRVASIMWS